MAFRKIIKDSEGGQKYVTEQEEELVFDQAPTKGSFNPVTSDGVANALSVGAGGESIGDVIPSDTSAENPLVNKDETNKIFAQNNNILWIGTSIPRYAEYPVAAAKACGYSCTNNSLGASTLCFPSEHPDVVESWSGRNLTATVNDLEVRYRQDVTDGVLTEDQLNEWKNYSYERSIIPYIDGTNPTQVSAIVIDHGFNDRESIHTLMADVEHINWDSYARANFVGAFRFLFSQITKINPFVKVIIAGYFQNVVPAYYSQEICAMQQLIAEKYDLPLMPAWKFSGINFEYVQNSSNYIEQFNATYGTDYTKMSPNASGYIPLFQFFCPDKVHPHSDLTGNSNRRLNAVYTKLLKFSI